VVRRDRQRCSRGSRALLIGLGLLLGFIVTFIHASLAAHRAERGLRARAALAGSLALTDLALFTEARYTRHPSQADLHAAFQDYPGALEHFPTGALIAPPTDNYKDAEQPVAPAASVPH
jgi:hypothetical protein